MTKRRLAFALAVLSAAPVATLRAETLAATLPNGDVVLFDSATPTTFAYTKPVIGIPAGETVRGLDRRPLTRSLFVLTSANAVYEIDTNTGFAGRRGAFTPGLTGSGFGVDFNPTVDRIRVVSNADENVRLNPDTGGLAGSDTPLNPSGDAVAAAYDRNVQGATVTTLFVIDSTLDQLLRQGGVDGNPSPNGGTLTAIGALGVDAVGEVQFEITAQGNAYAAMTVGGSTGLYRINLTTGAATLIGAIGSGAIAPTGLAEGPDIGSAVPATSRLGLSALVAALALLGVARLRRRRAPSS
jgi:hypothetical protein